MDTALELLPADYWRWYLTANAPEGSDTQFTWEHFQGVVNKDLADVLGNFINRILRFNKSRFDGVVPAGGEPGEHEAWLAGEVDERLAAIAENHEAMRFRQAAAETRALWAAGNEYLTRAEPWTHFKTDRNKAAIGVRTALNLAVLMGIAAQPIIPHTAGKILDCLGVPDGNRRWPDEKAADLLDVLPEGLAVTPPDVLFAKIDDDQVAEWTERFGGEGS